MINVATVEVTFENIKSHFSVLLFLYRKSNFLNENNIKILMTTVYGMKIFVYIFVNDTLSY